MTPSLLSGGVVAKADTQKRWRSSGATLQLNHGSFRWHCSSNNFVLHAVILIRAACARAVLGCSFRKPESVWTSLYLVRAAAPSLLRRHPFHPYQLFLKRWASSLINILHAEGFCISHNHISFFPGTAPHRHCRPPTPAQLCSRIIFIVFCTDRPLERERAPTLIDHSPSF